MESMGGKQFSVERQGDNVLLKSCYEYHSPLANHSTMLTRDNARALGQALLAAAGGNEAERYRDADGDIWERDEQGKYRLVEYSDGRAGPSDTTYGAYSLGELENSFGPLTPLPAEEKVEQQHIGAARYYDCEGDIWERDEQGLFTMVAISGVDVSGAPALRGWSLNRLSDKFGPLTPLPAEEKVEQQHVGAARIRDSAGDIWERDERGKYKVVEYSDGEAAPDDSVFSDYSLGELESSLGPLTPVDSQPDIADILERLSRGLTEEASKESGCRRYTLHCISTQLDVLVGQLRESK